jgi:hypothetical protein
MDSPKAFSHLFAVNYSSNLLRSFYVYIIGVHCMKVICRIKFRVKHLLVYVEHIALAFFHFTTCILRGLGTLLLVLYFFISIDCKYMYFMFVTHIYEPFKIMIWSHIWIFHDKVTETKMWIRVHHLCLVWEQWWPEPCLLLGWLYREHQIWGIS